MLAAFSPSFGWIPDHCEVIGDPHSHPHICVHHAGGWPAVPLIAVGLAFFARVALTLLRALGMWWSARSASRSLLHAACGTTDFGAVVLPTDLPQAFVLGFLRPRMFITRGLLAPEAVEHLPAIRAHERAHIDHADALYRLFAHGALAFHLPLVATLIDGLLGRAQELAADQAAADAVGSREDVATALVFMAKSQVGVPRAAHSFGAGEVEARVHALLGDEPRGDRPRTMLLISVSLVLTIMTALGADSVHHGLEVLLGVLSH